MPERDLTNGPRVTLATCRRRPRLTESDTLLERALRARGATVDAAPWDSIDPATTPGLVCLRSTWDYVKRWQEFRGWVMQFERRPGILWNPPATVLWNADKLYLRELGEAGIALPITEWHPPDRRPDVDAFLRRHDLERAVIKPRISGTAHGTHVMTRGAALDDDEWESLDQAGSLVQAFVDEIAAGEISLIYLDGTFSHAVRKLAAPGEFRVQADFGGTVQPLTPTALVCAFGDAVLRAVAYEWLYARIDLVVTARSPLLMELEILEPDLFLAYGAEAPDRLAAALLATRGAG